MKKEIRYGKHMIGEGHPWFCVAELSRNHLKDYNRAVAIIAEAK